jgi:tetratricopeptide (TPR) repeat protein
MTQMSVAELLRTKRRLVDDAVRFATQSKWHEAEAKNREILEVDSNDHEAWNRLGKALLELGRYREAHEAYSATLERDKGNIIALKQSKRLAVLVSEGIDQTTVESRKLDPKLMVEETGKTRVIALPNRAPAATIALLQAGDELFLQVEGSAITVTDSRGEALGELQLKVAARLANLMNRGNRYVAGVVGINDKEVRILIREVYQDASQLGVVSFPAKAVSQPSAYSHLRAGVERRDIDEDEYVIDEEGDDVDDDAEESGADVDEYGDVDGNRDDEGRDD